MTPFARATRFSSFLTGSPLPVVDALGGGGGRAEGLVGAVDRDAGGDEVQVPVARLSAGELQESLLLLVVDQIGRLEHESLRASVRHLRRLFSRVVRFHGRNVEIGILMEVSIFFQFWMGRVAGSANFVSNRAKGTRHGNFCQRRASMTESAMVCCL